MSFPIIFLPPNLMEIKPTSAALPEGDTRHLDIITVVREQSVICICLNIHWKFDRNGFYQSFLPNHSMWAFSLIFQQRKKNECFSPIFFHSFKLALLQICHLLVCFVMPKFQCPPTISLHAETGLITIILQVLSMLNLIHNLHSFTNCTSKNISVKRKKIQNSRGERRKYVLLKSQ